MQLEIASLLVTGPRGGGGDTASLLLASPHIIPLPLQTTEPLVVKWTPTLPLLELESGEK